MSKYLGDWDCRADLASDFEVRLNDNIEIIVACYQTGHYSGQAIVIFEKGEKLYLIEASHCSCYGLEGQWNAELINEDFLRHKLNKGDWLYDDIEHNMKISEVIKEYLKGKIT
jgi:hypothetical protein